MSITIRRKINRPGPEVLKPFKDVSTGFIADANNGRGCLHHSVKPLDPVMRLCGAAITAKCGPMDNLAAMAILDFVSPGDVVVIDSGRNDAAAVIGDLWALSAKNVGAAGIVCDGLVRDVAGLLEADIPVFASGWCPNACKRNGPGSINLPVTCGGIHVEPGDIVVADRDGIVVVPLAEAQAVATRLEAVKQKEIDSVSKIKRREKLLFWDRAAMAANGALQYLD